MLCLYVNLITALHAVARRALPGTDDERGQTSAEYALVLLGAAAVALLIVAWATKSDMVGKLFDAVFKSVIGKAK